MVELINDIEKIIVKHNLRQKKRDRDIIHKRMFLFNLLKSYKIPVLHIGKYFNVHHATVIHNINKYEELMAQNDKLLEKDTELYRRFFRMKRKHYTIDLAAAKYILKNNDGMLKELRKKMNRIIDQLETIQNKYKKDVEL